MDRAQRDRFEILQASAPMLAAGIRALDEQVREARRSANEAGRAAEPLRRTLDSAMSADDALRAEMIRMRPYVPGTGMSPHIFSFAGVGWLLGLLLFGLTKPSLLGLLIGTCVGIAVSVVASRQPVARFRRLAKATRLEVVGMPLLYGPMPGPIVPPGEATLENLERHVAALESGAVARAAFIEGERTRRSLIEADSQRLSLELERGAAQRAELVVQHKWAVQEYDERQRQEAENVTYIP